MYRQILFTAFALFVLSSASVLQPRDLADEAEEQLEQLLSLVTGNILAAHNDLDDMGTEFQAYTIDVYENGNLDLEQEHELVNSQIASLKALAESAGYDVTSCTNIREEVLGRLPARYSEQMASCIANINAERQTILQDATYIIDIVINKVHNLERQLGSCRGDILCISPLVTEIELDKIRLPQSIQTEVQAVEGLLDVLRLSVETCADTNVSSYIADASSIVRDITACVDRILG